VVLHPDGPYRVDEVQGGDARGVRVAAEALQQRHYLIAALHGRAGARAVFHHPPTQLTIERLLGARVCTARRGVRRAHITAWLCARTIYKSQRRSNATVSRSWSAGSGGMED
jgi:hypothetical protein